MGEPLCFQSRIYGTAEIVTIANGCWLQRGSHPILAKRSLNTLCGYAPPWRHATAASVSRRRCRPPADTRRAVLPQSQPDSFRGDDLPRPIEQFADGGQVLLYGGHGVALLLEHLAVPGHMQRLPLWVSQQPRPRFCGYACVTIQISFPLGPCGSALVAQYPEVNYHRIVCATLCTPYAVKIRSKSWRILVCSNNSSGSSFAAVRCSPVHRCINSATMSWCSCDLGILSSARPVTIRTA
jgi:hypothetical protein